MLDNKLNLVCKVETPQGEVHVHHALVGYDCFKANYRLISRISARMFEDGAEFLAPLTGAFMFNDVAGHGVDLTRIRPRDIDAMTGIDKIAIEKDLAFMGELKRMTNVICMNNGNWEHIPLTEALQSSFITDQQYDEVLGTVIFFTVFRYAKMGGQVRMEGLLRAYNSLTTSLNCVDYLKSLPIPTSGESTGTAVA